MSITQCEICGCPATIHDSKLVSGLVETHHYCGQHAPLAYSTPLELDPHQAARAMTALAERCARLSASQKSQLALELRMARRSRHA